MGNQKQQYRENSSKKKKCFSSTTIQFNDIKSYINKLKEKKRRKSTQTHLYKKNPINFVISLKQTKLSLIIYSLAKRFFFFFNCNPLMIVKSQEFLHSHHKQSRCYNRKLYIGCPVELHSVQEQYHFLLHNQEYSLHPYLSIH